MKVYFDGSIEYTFIVVADVNGNVQARCDFNYTDCEDDEKLDAFVVRHGGEVACIEYLKERSALAEAKVIASAKVSCLHVNPDADKAYQGRVMGVTSHHAVLSLGRTAVIIDLSSLDGQPRKDQDVSIVFKAGRGSVSCEEHGHSPLQGMTK